MTKEMLSENSSEDAIHIPKFDPPPLFSPNVYIPELNEKKSFGPRGYINRISYIIDKSMHPMIEAAQKHNFSIIWKRKLDIQVLEARNISPQFNCCFQKARCKVTIGKQVSRTELAPLPPRTHSATWDETLHFTVDEPCNIKIEVYLINVIIPNDVIGYITISPNQLVERDTITKWFPFDTQGELKLSISLSAPEMAPLKFSIDTPITLSFRDCRLLNAKGEKVFTIQGTWPNVISILDAKDLSINKIYEDNEKIFKIYLYGQTHSSLTITWFHQKGINTFYLEGISSVTQVVHYKRDFNFKLGDLCVANASHKDKFAHARTAYSCLQLSS